MKSTWKMIRDPRFNHPILVPDDEDAIEYAQTAKEGQHFVIDLKVQGNVKQHKLFWALMRFVVDNSDKYDNTADLVRHLKIATGNVREFHGYDKKMYIEAISMSYASMDGVKFQRFFKSCMNIICEKFAPTLSEKLEVEFWQFFERGAA